MALQLQLFKYADGDQLANIRTVEIDGEVWFVGSDVAKTLGYQRPSDAIRQHCKEMGTVKYRISDNQGVPHEYVLINEPNVYRLVVKSQLASAEKFEAWLFEDVLPSIRKKGYYGKIDRTALPNFIERYKENYHKIPGDHFSVISEMFTRLYMELERVGYIIPDKGIDGKKLVPDISVGLGFAKFLKANNSQYYEQCKKYTHTFPDGREVEANMYHIDALSMFIRYIREKWIPENAQTYFKSRDPLALDYLPKLLGTGK